MSEVCSGNKPFSVPGVTRTVLSESPFGEEDQRYPSEHDIISCKSIQWRIIEVMKEILHRLLLRLLQGTPPKRGIIDDCKNPRNSMQIIDYRSGNSSSFKNGS